MIRTRGITIYLLTLGITQTDYSAEFKGLILSFRHPVPARVEDGLEPAAKGGGQRLRDDPAARPPRPLGLLHKGMRGRTDEDD